MIYRSHCGNFYAFSVLDFSEDDELDYGTFPTHLVHIPEDVGVERPWSDEENPSSGKPMFTQLSSSC